jgi:RimJ/RimL family protein N-acetyltransferase
MTRLRQVQLADVEALDRQHDGAEQAGEFGWFGFDDRRGRLRRRIDEGKLFADGRGVLAIADDDDNVVGELSWITTFNGPPPGGDCWNLGIWLLPEHRGKGHGTEAQRLGAAYLFAHTLLERVEASTESGNIAEQKALEKAGFTREGVLRRACFRSGEWRDMVLYSKLRGE